MKLPISYKVLVCLTLFSGPLLAQVPALLNYQGRVAVGEVNFNGTGQFKFALVSADGTVTYWNNDGSPLTASAPARAVSLPVTKGLYSILLGDPSLGASMTALPSAIFTNPDVRLRVWFNDGVNGFELLTPDQRLAPTPYLADGSVKSNSLIDGAIVGSKIAPGAINGTHVAAGSLDFNRFSVLAAPGAGQVLGFDGSSLAWITPQGGGGGSLTLPYSAVQSATSALFSINNSSTSSNAIGMYGHSQSTTGVYGQTRGNTAAGVIGRNDGTSGLPTGAGVYGYSATQGNGVRALSESGIGLWASTNGESTTAVYGQTDKITSVAGRFVHAGLGTALEATAQGFGNALSATSQGTVAIYGQSYGSSGAGISGYSAATGGAGVRGRSGGSGAGVYATSDGTGVGLYANSGSNHGIDARTLAANKSAIYASTEATGAFGMIAVSTQGTAVWAKTSKNTEPAGYYWNDAGGDALRATGSTSLYGRAAIYGSAPGSAATLTTIGQGGDGVDATTSGDGKAAFYGHTTAVNAFGLSATSGQGTAIYARTDAANHAGVYGEAGLDSSKAGQFNHKGNGAAIGAFAQGGDGVDSTTLGAGKSAFFGHTTASGAYAVSALSTQGTAVWAKTEKNSEAAGFFWNSTGGNALLTEGNATIRGTATVRVLTINGGVDLAEPFTTRDDAEFPKGSVLVISDERPGELQLSEEEYDTRVAGVISGANGINPGLQLMQKGVNDTGGQPVALTGRVYCQADATFGSIKPGDLLTTSITPGHARKVDDHIRAQGAVLGKAMSALPDGRGYVLVLVTLQ